MSRHGRYPERSRVTELAIGVLLLAGWACNNPNGTGGGCSTTGADVTINAQDNLTFDKPSLTISKGQEVCWQNLGTAFHTVTATSAVPADSNWTAAAFDHQLNPGLIVSHVFSTVGDYSYHCSIHAGMTGTISVR